MLTHILIRNLAVIDAAEVELAGGLTVLTGETGAGKSILVDALALALGARADSKAVRSGADRCEITASFSIAAKAEIVDWLSAQDLDGQDGECLVRRIVRADGPSRGYINGQPVTMQTLQDLGERLFDICGQQAHQGLRHRAVQRELLDAFGGHEKLCADLAVSHQDWRASRDKLDALQSDGDNRRARQELLGFQLRELEGLDLQAGELESMQGELARLTHSSRIESGLQAALLELYDAEEGTAQATAARARQHLESLLEVCPDLAGTAGLLNEVEALLVESADQLRQQLGQLEHDPAREQLLGDRVAEVRSLARKHRIEPTELVELTTRLQQELESLDDSDEALSALRLEVEEKADAVRKSAAALSKARKKAASRLAKSVSASMQDLGMPGGQFSISLQPGDEDPPPAHGSETVEFAVAANPGQAAGALARVASGGELARISLALQVTARGVEGLDTLVFDEVDSGVGGGVAEMVGARLQQLSGGRQVLCVTHLPQVACQADQHLRVVKVTDGSSTRTAVKSLTLDERVEEIARMLGGVKITQRTRAHAREMLEAGAARRAG